MQKPESITFTGLEISTSQLERRIRYSAGPMDPSWIRTQFFIPDNHTSVQAVTLWLENNCSGLWATYHYMDPKGKGNYIMVVRFEEKNDALMFKLRDGHKAWKTT